MPDPHVWTDAPDRLNTRFAVYEPLVRLKASGGHYGVLAESWETSDARSWTFTLRSGVGFHNGSTLSASDVVTALDRARDPMMAGELGTTGLYGAYLAEAAIDTAGTNSLRIVTPRPMADLLDVLADIPIVCDTGRQDAQKGVCGTGPYRVIDGGPAWLLMEAARPHWAGVVPVDRLTWRTESDDGGRVAMMLRGEADVATELPPSARAHAGSKGPATVHEVPTSSCVIFMCNAAAGACADRRVRQALNHAIDVPAIIDRVKLGAARPLNGPLTPLSLGHDPSVPRYAYDAQAAGALLRDAGYGDGLELVLNVPNTSPIEAPAVAALAAEQYAKIGIDLSIRVWDDRPAYAARVKAKQIDDLACFDSTPVSTYRIFREKFHAGAAGPWWQGYVNAEVDRAIDDASELASPSARRDCYRRAFRAIRDDAAWVFLYNPTALVGLGPAARDVSIEPQGILRFDAARV